MFFIWIYILDIDVLNKRIFFLSLNLFIIIFKKIIFLSVYVEELIKLKYFEIVNYIDVLFI